jgi:hypothetical protein
VEYGGDHGAVRSIAGRTRAGSSYVRAQDIKLQGRGGPLAEPDFSKTPFHGTLEVKQVFISDFTKFLNSAALNGTDGVMSGQTRINNDSGKLTAEGETNIQNVKVRGMELGYPVALQYDLTDDMPTEVLLR